ncbi:UNVERIFIED_CONTAM: hypothetical protein Slati_0466600 [Sesamum latifolium]|uniref:Uncharacterized protein n=1 Tax=Sesamum latifolium TaxID=2727402 RepID=A0AAW2XWL7_9LAMI
MKQLFYEQLHQFIMETINSTPHGSQVSEVGSSSQLERGRIPGSQGIDEQIRLNSIRINHTN